MKPKSMSLKQYSKWIQSEQSRKASLPSFFPAGVQRTKNILKGKANEASVKKRNAFLERHLTQYKSNPTERRRIAIRNWGFALTKTSNEKKNA